MDWGVRSSRKSFILVFAERILPCLSHSVVKPKLPASFFTDTFAKLYNAIDAVHNAQPVSQSLEELYRVGVTQYFMPPSSPFMEK